MHFVMRHLHYSAIIKCNCFLINNQDMLEVLKGNINMKTEKGFLNNPTIYKVK